ncbi:response regulator [Sphingomonas nostoxanthinifaciens]|nr:response regulator [Sphingomonas nostoxanthinifaciens]
MPRPCGPVLICAPEGRDAAVIAEILQNVEIETAIASNAAEFQVTLDSAGVAIVACEVLDEPMASAVETWVQAQPGWSDLPIIVLMDRPENGLPPGDGPTAYPGLGNVTLIEKPCFARTLISAARSALRARQRQLQLAAELDERHRTQTALQESEHRFRSELEELVRLRTAALEAETAEREQAQEALRQSQKMEAVGQLTGGIAHDFNNLLAGISGSLELLDIRLRQGRISDIERYVRTAQEATRRAASLTHRLLAFSRRQTLDPKVVDPNKLIAGLEDLLRRSVGPDFEIEVVQAGGLWRAKLDPSQLENALLNLCINARDAMAPSGGRITIETANRWLDDRTGKERDLPAGQYVSLCVTDTGSGMSADIVEKVFDPFFTTKPLGQGTGLGLSMVYGFVRQSGGQVRIYSEVGQGTTVCLYLPRFSGTETEDEMPDVASIDGGAGETVLVIDDEPAIRMLVAEVLEDNGYQVLTAEDGSAGLKVLQSDVRIDLLVTDVGLPGGLNGRQVADAARETRPDLRVLFITGYAENAVVGNGHLAEGMSVITKPFAMTDMANKVRELIDSNPS